MVKLNRLSWISDFAHDSYNSTKKRNATRKNDASEREIDAGSADARLQHQKKKRKTEEDRSREAVVTEEADGSVAQGATKETVHASMKESTHGTTKELSLIHI